METRLGVDDNNGSRTLRYPLPANSLTQQCDAIMASILQAGLPCLGRTNLPLRTDVRPIEYQGLGIPNLGTS
jgi:hypothetical protein